MLKHKLYKILNRRSHTSVFTSIGLHLVLRFTVDILRNIMDSKEGMNIFNDILGDIMDSKEDMNIFNGILGGRPYNGL